VNSFVFPYSDQIISRKVPQDEYGLQVRQLFLEWILQGLDKDFQRGSGGLVCNVDEVGFSDWEDRKMRKVVTRVQVLGQAIPCLISRNAEHISAIACAPAAGESITPSFITSQNSSSVRVQLKKHSIQFDREGLWSVKRMQSLISKRRSVSIAARLSADAILLNSMLSTVLLEKLPRY
jgi:hypothetical protein